MISSSMITSFGLSWWQSWICVWLGYTIAAIFVVITARIGATYHIGCVKRGISGITKLTSTGFLSSLEPPSAYGVRCGQSSTALQWHASGNFIPVLPGYSLMKQVRCASLDRWRVRRAHVAGHLVQICSLLVSNLQTWLIIARTTCRTVCLRIPGPTLSPSLASSSSGPSV
jgi:hypothetical protein